MTEVDILAVLAGLTLAALYLLSVGVCLFLLGLPGWRDFRKQRVEIVDDDTAPVLDRGPRPGEPCPSCGRNAGHNDGCSRVELRRAAKAIEIPREGEIK